MEEKYVDPFSKDNKRASFVAGSKIAAKVKANLDEIEYNTRVKTSIYLLEQEKREAEKKRGSQSQERRRTVDHSRSSYQRDTSQNESRRQSADRRRSSAVPGGKKDTDRKPSNVERGGSKDAGRARASTVRYSNDVDKNPSSAQERVSRDAGRTRASSVRYSDDVNRKESGVERRSSKEVGRARASKVRMSKEAEKNQSSTPESDQPKAPERRRTFVEHIKEKEKERQELYGEARAAAERASLFEEQERKFDFEREHHDGLRKRAKSQRLTEIIEREQKIKMDSINPNLEALAIKYNMLPAPNLPEELAKAQAGSETSMGESLKEQRKKSKKEEYWDGDPRDPNAKRVSFDAGAAKRLSYDAAAREKKRRLSLIAEGKDPDKIFEEERLASEAAAKQEREIRERQEQERKLSRSGRPKPENNLDLNDPRIGQFVDGIIFDSRRISGNSWLEYNLRVPSPDASSSTIIEPSDEEEEVDHTKDEEVKIAWWAAKDTVLLDWKAEVAQDAQKILSNAPFICLFFATHMHYQTRVLVKFMNYYLTKMKADGCDFKFIFVSMDDTEFDCQELMTELGDNWYSVPFNDQIHRRFARNQCNVSKCPRLIIFKNIGEGILLTGHAKDDIQEWGEGAWYYWLEMDTIMEQNRARKRRGSHAKKEDHDSPKFSPSPHRPSV